MLYDAYVTDNTSGAGKFVECFVAGVSANVGETYRVASYCDPSGKVIVPDQGSWIVVEEHPDLYNLIVVQGNNHNLPGSVSSSNILYNSNGVSVEHDRMSGEFSINITTPAPPGPPPQTTDGANVTVTETPPISAPIFSITISSSGEVAIGGSMAMFALVNETFVDLFNQHMHLAPQAPSGSLVTMAPLVPIQKPAVTTLMLKSL